MRPLSASELLKVWEEGWERDPVSRPLLLLERACPGEDLPVLRSLSVGRRDRRLRTLRAWMFGEEITGTSVCPACNERVELDFRLPAPGSDSSERTPHSTEELFSLTEDGYEVEFRLPDSSDLEALLRERVGPAAPDPKTLILDRCLVEIRRNGEATSPAALPEGVRSAVVREMESADPEAAMHTALECPSCKHCWEANLDIASYLWNEVDAWARRTLHEVDTLARVYGWTEAQILNLSATRRRLYLELADA